MLKRFVWSEGDLYSIQLKGDLYTVAQLLKKPYVAFFDIKRNNSAFFGGESDLISANPLGVCMVLNDFFKKCAFEKIGKNVLGAQAIELPELFISKDGRQWLHPGDGNDLKYNIVKIDPNVGDQGILGNHVIARDINKSDLELIRKYEMVGFNTGYELIRRLIVSLEKGVWIDPSKEQQLLGVDNYPLKTVEEMWRAGVPKYQ